MKEIIMNITPKHLAHFKLTVVLDLGAVSTEWAGATLDPT